MSLTEKQRRKQNNRYRTETPRKVFRDGFSTVLTHGELPEETRIELIEALWDRIPESQTETPVDPWASPTTPSSDEGNGLARVFVKHYDHIALHVSEQLWRQQPIGVLLRPINDEVRKAGEAIVTRTTPRSPDVEADVMPASHYKLQIEPMPLWLEKWVSDDQNEGYSTV